MTPDDLSERLWNFAARIGKVVDALPDKRLGRHVAAGLLSERRIAPLHDECEQLAKIIAKSTLTARNGATRRCAAMSPRNSMRNEKFPIRNF